MALHVLPPADAALWWVQRPDAPLQIAGLALFEAGPLHDERGRLRVAEVTDRVAAGLAATPRLRQRIRPLPFATAVAFEDDPSFDLARHVRTAVVPGWGSGVELRKEVARILREPLDPTRPLWEMWLLDGVDGDRVALLLRASHVLLDGTALVAVADHFLDPAPDAPPPSLPAPWHPDRPAGLLDAAGTGLAARARAVQGAVRQVGSMVGTDALTGVANAVLDVVGRPARPSPRTLAPPFTGPVGPRHEAVWTSVSLDDVRRVARAHSATVNDVVMTMATGAVADYLAMEGAPERTRLPRVLVPVSVHTRDHDGEEVHNEFSMLLVDLPVDLRDPVGRLRVLREELGPLKRSARTSIAARAFPLALALPPWMLRPFGRVVLDRQPVVDLAVTNLAGPSEARYLAGARMLEVHPIVVGTGNIATIVGVMSYRDRLGVCVTADTSVVADPGVLLAGFTRSLAALLDRVPDRSSPSG